MKKCPMCAEEIQDEAVKCKWIVCIVIVIVIVIVIGLLIYGLWYTSYQRAIIGIWVEEGDNEYQNTLFFFKDGTFSREYIFHYNDSGDKNSFRFYDYLSEKKHTGYYKFLSRDTIKTLGKCKEIITINSETTSDVNDPDIMIQ